MPSETTPLNYQGEFSSEDYQRIGQGLIPKAMEQKWFIYLEADKLFLHRSWSGACIFEVEFENHQGRHRVHKAQASLEAVSHPDRDEHFNALLLKFLIEGLLLGRDIPFPTPNQLPDNASKELFQHAVAGRGSSKRAPAPNAAQAPKKRKPWWRFW